MANARDSEIRDWCELDRDSCRNTEYITIPYYNGSQNIKDGWLVSSSTGVHTKNANSLAPLLAKRQ